MTDCGSLLLSGPDAHLRVRVGWIGRVSMRSGLVDPARRPVGAIGCDPLEAERCLGAHAQGTARGPAGVARVPCRDHRPGRALRERETGGRLGGAGRHHGRAELDGAWPEARRAPGAKTVSAPELT